MRIVVKAGYEQKQAILAKGIAADVQVNWLADEKQIPEADAYFDLCFEEEGQAFAGIIDKPVFINSVIETGKSFPSNVIRLNAWNGFLQQDLIEIVAANPEVVADSILKAMGWRYGAVPDIPGMIAPRIIAMIINEAYFGLGDSISSREEIDIAMKLGTNYPMGPFEWSKKIGLKKIYTLLKTLSEQDKRYTVAPALEKELINQ